MNDAIGVYEVRTGLYVAMYCRPPWRAFWSAGRTPEEARARFAEGDYGKIQAPDFEPEPREDLPLSSR